MHKISDVFYSAGTVFVLMMMLLLCLWAVLPMSNPSGAKRALTAAGYRNIEITGAEFFVCNRKYSFSTGFNAVDADGKAIRGAVCDSFFYPTIIRKTRLSERDYYFASAILIVGVVLGIIVFLLARKLGLIDRFYVSQPPKRR